MNLDDVDELVCTSRPEARGSGVDDVIRCLKIDKQPRLPTLGIRVGRCDAPRRGNIWSVECIVRLMTDNTEDMGGLPYLDDQGADSGLAPQQPRSGKKPSLMGIKQARGAPAKCPHGRRKSRCTDCGGSVQAECPHGRRKSRCTECGGSGLCQHGRRKSRCTDCGGSVQAKCPHGRQKSRCTECDGSGLCQHGRRKSKCSECQTLADIAGLDVSKVMSCGLAPKLLTRPAAVHSYIPVLLTRRNVVP